MKAANWVVLLSVFLVSCGIGSEYGIDKSTYDYRASVAAAPEFQPWPPPVPSARYILPASTFANHGRFKSLGDVSDFFLARLRRAGYGSFGFFTAPDGFVLVTPMEAIDPTGVPHGGTSRWVAPVRPTDGAWLTRWPDMLLSRPTGYYRVLAVFVTTDVTGSDPRRVVDFDIMNSWVNTGMVALPSRLADRRFTAQHVVYVNLYELAHTQGERPTLLRSATTDVYQQMRATGISVDGLP